MVNSFNLHIKLYSLIFFVFIISTLNFYDKNGIVFLGSGFVAGLSFLFALKNYIYRTVDNARMSWQENLVQQRSAALHYK